MVTARLSNISSVPFVGDLMIRNSISSPPSYGGTCCLAGIEEIIEKNTRIPTYKPIDPMFVTPLGIAYSCTDKER